MSMKQSTVGLRSCGLCSCDVNAAGAAAECQKAVAVLENHLQNKKHSGMAKKEHRAGGRKVPNEMFREMNMKMLLDGISDAVNDLCKGYMGKRQQQKKVLMLCCCGSPTMVTFQSEDSAESVPV